MNITLKPEQQKLIQARIESGKYSTVEEIITAALQLLEERDRQYENWIAETQPKVAVGIAELERGEGIDGEVVIAKLREKLTRQGINSLANSSSPLKWTQKSDRPGS